MENDDEVLETSLESETDTATLDLQDFNILSDRSVEDTKEGSAESLIIDSLNGAAGDSLSPDSDFLE